MKRPTANVPTNPPTRARRTALLSLVVVAGPLVVVVGWSAFSVGDDVRDRVEREHSIRLPDSARDIQAMGDASNPVLVRVGLDRGASTIFVLDRSELEELLDQYAPSDRPGYGPGAPGNRIYQPASVPWDDGDSPEMAFVTSEPPGSADFTSVEVFGLDAETVAVWLYSDWN